jgi:hypothetical protein
MANCCRRSMLSPSDRPRQSKINSCTPIVAKARMSRAMSCGSPEKGRRDPSGLRISRRTTPLSRQETTPGQRYTRPLLSERMPNPRRRPECYGSTLRIPTAL